jgi:PAS domain S-box-containing protein
VSFLDLVQSTRLMFVGMLAFVIAYQLWVAHVRRSEPILYFVAAWEGAALIAVIGRSVQHATTDPTVVILGSRVFHTGVLALVPLGISLMHEIRGAPKNVVFRFCAVVTSVPVALVWIGDTIVSSRAQAFETLAGVIQGPEPASLTPLAIPYVLAIAIYLAYIARRGRQDLLWHQRLSLYVMMLVLFPMIVNDALLYSDSLLTIELAGVGLFAIVIAINVGIFVRAGDLFSDLEKTVDERTKELVARERELVGMLAARRRILDAMPETVCLLDGGRIDYVNEAGARFFGQATTEIQGSRFLDRVVESQVVEAEHCLSTLDNSQVAELRFLGAESERTGELAGLTLELDDGPRTLITIRDVTDRKHLLAKLQMADRLASVGTLAAGVAHEINNPLAFISGNLELMKIALDTEPRDLVEHGPDALPQLIDECITGTRRIAHIVRDLNLFARGDAEPSVLDIRPILEQALKMAMVAIRHRADVATDFGPTPPVRAEARQLSQVFLNLLINAFQAIPDDGAAHSIQASTSTRADGWAVIDIADSGTGVDPALLPHVFDPFVTTKPVGAGTGLGLFMCHRLVTALGGEIRLIPREPTGTIARVAFPPASTDRAGVPSESNQASDPRQPCDIRLLVVDDEDIMLRVLQRQLRRYDVTAASSGLEAIERLETSTYDVVVCDLMMPGCNGAAVWDRAMQLGYEGRFLIMTGGATTQPLRDFLDRTQVTCLEKPIAFADLESAIHAAIGKGSGHHAE